MSDVSVTSAPVAWAPVQESDRLTGIDAARGFALLGIFMVNAAFFGEAFGNAMTQTPGAKDPGVLNQALFYFTKIFCEGKFYGLFSLLFGAGFMLQWSRIETGRFLGVYWRRLGLLLVLGMCHAWLLWYGDILFLYAFAGMVLLLSRRLSPRVLVTLGVVGIVFVAVGSSALGLLEEMGQQSAAARDKPADLTGEPFAALMRGMNDQAITQPQSAEWIRLEERAYREGGYLQALGFRMISWVFMIIMSVLTFFWSIVAMFFLGAALVKSGLLAAGREAALKRLTVIVLAVGAPMSIIGGLLPMAGAAWWVKMCSTLGLWLGAPLLSVGYLGVLVLVTRSGAASGLTRLMSNAGRMALTNYLTQTVVATFVFYHWGLAQFGLWERWERALLVVGVWSCQLVISTAWLSQFRMGPMEWLWRSVTYWKLQPMARRANPGPSPT